MVSTRIEGRVQVVEMRPTINQNAETIDHVIAKMQHSQLSFIDLLMDDFKRVLQHSRKPAEVALQPLRVLRRSHQMRTATWFNTARNIQLVTSQALAAKKEVLRLLQRPKTWDEVRARSDEDKRGIAEDMFQAAFLSASEGDAHSALQLLNLSMQEAPPRDGLHPRLTQEDVRVVEALADELNEGASPEERIVPQLAPPRNIGAYGSLNSSMFRSGSSAVDGPPLSQKSSSFGSQARGEGEELGSFERLLLLQLFVSRGCKPPWCEAVVLLVDQGGALVLKGLRQLVERHQLVRQLPLARGTLVFGSKSGDETWCRGQLLRMEKEHPSPLLHKPKDASRSARSLLPLLQQPHDAGSPDRKLNDMTYTVSVHSEERVVKAVLPISEGGCGGVLRAAADLGSVGVVELLLNAKVSVHEADARARTAMHYAAEHTSTAHARVCEVLVRASLAEPMNAFHSGFTNDLNGTRPYDLALMRQSALLRAIKPSQMDKELSACEERLPDEPVLARRRSLEGSGVQSGQGGSSLAATRRRTADERMLERLKQEDAARRQRGEDRAQIDAPVACNVTMLMVASARGHVKTVRWLLQLTTDDGNGSDHGGGRVAGAAAAAAGSGSGTGDTPHRSVPLVDVFHQSDGGCTALTMAAEAGHTDVVALLFEHLAARSETEPSRLANLAEKNNATALMRAAQHGFESVATLLLDHDAQIDVQRDDTQRTALLLAARSGFVGVMTLLIRRGASLLHKDKDGQTALSSAAKFNHVQAVHLLLEARDAALAPEPTPSAPAAAPAASGAPASAPAPSAASNEEVEQALALAARFGHDESVRLLLMHGSSVNTPDPLTSDTPLHWVCRRGHPAVVPQLLEARADVNCVNAAGQHALMVCCEEGHQDIAHMLITARSDPMHTDPTTGLSALMLASRAGHEQLVAYLLLEAAREVAHEMLAMRDKHGRTALMHAALAGQSAVVRVLLATGADRNATDHQHHSALMMAFHRGHMDTVDEFRSVASPLQRHRPPLCALAKAQQAIVDPDVILGVGALVIDVGTSDMKLLAVTHFLRAQTHELANVKLPRDAFSQGVWEPGVWDHDSSGGAPAAGMRPTAGFHAATSQLRAGLEKLRAPPWARRITWTHAFMGVTAWYRQLDPALRKPVDGFLEALCEDLTQALEALGQGELSSLGRLCFLWQELSGSEEAQNECRAVEYAMGEQCRPQPIAIFAGGSGSLQLTGLDAFVSVDAPLAKGVATLEAGGRSAAALDAWKADVTANVRTATQTSALIDMLASGAERAHEQQEQPSPPLTIVLISAFYYVALAAGLVEPQPCRISTQGVEHSASAVCAALERLMCDERAKTKDVANAARLHAVLHAVFDAAHLDDVVCFFARDWVLEQGEEFRTTWSAGWWLERLLEQFRYETLPISYANGLPAALPAPSELPPALQGERPPSMTGTEGDAGLPAPAAAPAPPSRVIKPLHRTHGSYKLAPTTMLVQEGLPGAPLLSPTLSRISSSGQV